MSLSLINKPFLNGILGSRPKGLQELPTVTLFRLKLFRHLRITLKICRMLMIHESLKNLLNSINSIRMVHGLRNIKDVDLHLDAILVGAAVTGLYLWWRACDSKHRTIVPSPCSLPVCYFCSLGSLTPLSFMIEYIISCGSCTSRYLLQMLAPPKPNI